MQTAECAPPASSIWFHSSLEVSFFSYGFVDNFIRTI